MVPQSRTSCRPKDQAILLAMTSEHPAAVCLVRARSRRLPLALRFGPAGLHSTSCRKSWILDHLGRLGLLELVLDRARERYRFLQAPSTSRHIGGSCFRCRPTQMLACLAQPLPARPTLSENLP